MSLNPNVKICTHIKVTGIRCGSPALRGEKFCYFHERMIRGVPTPPKARIHPMALLENEEAIQVALMETINAIVRNQIDMQRASLIIRALSIAVRNSRRVRFDRCESEMIRKLPELEPAEAQSAALQDASPSEGTPQSLPVIPPRSSRRPAFSPAGRGISRGHTAAPTRTEPAATADSP
jgi:hypothetical protein